MENNFAFVLLAGGKSERMGHPKGLLPYQGGFWLEYQLKQMAKTECSAVYIGLGFHASAYCNALPWLASAIDGTIIYQNRSLRAIVNPTPERGSFSTLQTVLSLVPEQQTVLLCPIDVPLPSISTLNTLLKTHNTIVIPNYQGKNGHPVMMTPQFWKPLLQLDSSNNRLDFLIKVLPQSLISVVTVANAAVIQNLNTSEDWNDFQQKKDSNDSGY